MIARSSASVECRHRKSADRLCFDATGAESLEEPLNSRLVLGVPLDSGEVVILMCRRSWWMGALVGAIVGAGAMIAVWAVGKSLGPVSPLPSAALVGLAAGSAFFVVDHLRRLYVLTDRRVIREDRKLARLAHVESALASVRSIELVQNDLQRRIGDGTIVFRTEQGIIVWSGVGDATRIHTIAQEAVQRYGGSLRGM